jgi:hypothetical protein
MLACCLAPDAHRGDQSDQQRQEPARQLERERPSQPIDQPNERTLESAGLLLDRGLRSDPARQLFRATPDETDEGDPAQLLEFEAEVMLKPQRSDGQRGEEQDDTSRLFSSRLR